MESINKKKYDFLVIGAGVIGLNIALELKRRYADSKILIIEKEENIAAHASGRNSGVLHAGFYYSKDSLKAKFTKNGNLALTDYCTQKNIHLNRCGKLVVARNEQELSGLKELLQRGNDNGIALNFISEQEAKEIEPRVKTFHHALFSPTTSSVSPQAVMENLLLDARTEGIEVSLGEKFIKINKKDVVTSKKTLYANYIINAAGLYADIIAKQFGFSKNFTILPFKGLYLYASSNTESLRTHIYPVPDLKNPFLGVHFTVTAEGKVKIGPTAIPAFWREHYSGLSGLNILESLDIIKREMGLIFNAGFDFRKLAKEEFRKYNRNYLTKQAGELAQGVSANNYITWGKPGIRAQLLNTKTRILEMDFILEGDNKSMHVLNAVSPAFTCSIPFSKYVVDVIQNKV
jgi:L-2-hydroxyglutarate oxidase